MFSLPHPYISQVSLDLSLFTLHLDIQHLPHAHLFHLHTPSLCVYMCECVFCVYVSDKVIVITR